MSNETKTMEQIYKEKYSDDLFTKNPLYMVEAVGYLKALLQFMPSESWVESEIWRLLLVLKGVALK